MHMGRNTQRLVVLVLALSIAGFAVAGYLTYVHYNEDALVCTTGGCETVQQSEYSTIAGFPIAILGMLMFASVGALSLLRLRNLRWLSFDTATIFSWLLIFTAILYYCYLTYVELFVLEAICQWCVVSSVITLAILVIESLHVWRILDLSGEDDGSMSASMQDVAHRTK